MGVAQVVVIGGALHRLVVELGVVVVRGLFFCGVLGFEVLVVEQKEIAYGTAEPHFLSVNGVCLDIVFTFPVVYLFIAHGVSHALFDLRSPVCRGEREIPAYAVHGLVN